MYSKEVELKKPASELFYLERKTLMTRHWYFTITGEAEKQERIGKQLFKVEKNRLTLDLLLVNRILVQFKSKNVIEVKAHKKFIA